MTADAAKYLIQLEEKIRTEIGTNCYCSWDSMIDNLLRKQNYLIFFMVRLVARIKGIGRLAMGKFLRWQIVKNSKISKRLVTFAIRRQLLWKL